MTFLERLASGPPVITDGGTGTERQRLGCGAAEVHAAFVAAGAEVIVADSIAAAGLAVSDPARGAAALANAVAVAWSAHPAFVAASLGPSGPGIRDATHRREVYGALAAAAKAAGADVIFAETLLTFFDADAALDAARTHGVPVVVTFSLGEGYGLAPEHVSAWGIANRPDACGVNCGDGAEPTLAAFERFAGQDTHVPTVFRPSAGSPGSVTVSPDAFASIGRRGEGLGARIVGGCCGATPAHIAALAKTLRRDG